MSDLADKIAWLRRHESPYVNSIADEIERLRDQVDSHQQREDEIIVALGSKGILPSGIVAEIERLRAEKYVMVSGESLRKDNEALHEEIERLRTALERYGQHDRGCKAMSYHPNAACTCGLREALEGGDE